MGYVCFCDTFSMVCSSYWGAACAGRFPALCVGVGKKSYLSC